MGELDRAKIELDESCKCDPKCVLYFQSRSDLFLEMGNIDEALKDCELTIILNPRDY